MFAQVMQGRVKDEARLREQWARWERELKPGAKGFLGATAGIADDGTFIAIARFDSEESARRNSDRTEQDAWWSETASCFEGDVTFHDCTGVETSLDGGSDDAGFVQVMQGRAKDPARIEQIGREFEQRLTTLRPDLIGGLHAEHGDGSFTDVNYFTTEEEARKGESQDYPEEMQALFDEYGRLVEDLRYIDLKEPWLSSP